MGSRRRIMRPSWCLIMVVAPLMFQFSRLVMEYLKCYLSQAILIWVAMTSTRESLIGLLPTLKGMKVSCF
ncbi:unnamed protein product [Linum tenue]|uniref:Secreted protein n=1 Tax=Linum tenue TaxID=586396 RepID=A0AAV0RKP7_9ROSI|nr:unnamed protein product [Linum tenue]